MPLNLGNTNRVISQHLTTTDYRCEVDASLCEMLEVRERRPQWQGGVQTAGTRCESLRASFVCPPADFTFPDRGPCEGSAADLPPRQMWRHRLWL